MDGQWKQRTEVQIKDNRLLESKYSTFIFLVLFIFVLLVFVQVDDLVQVKHDKDE